jgi:uncharacterized protein (TIGR02147 family)
MELFDYLDYRLFLKDWYQRKKNKNPKFSYRVLAKIVGFRSAGFFTQILQGKTNISIEFIEGFCDVLKLKKTEREFFQTLVLFNQSKDPDRKKILREKLLAQRIVQAKRLTPDLYRFLEKWYNVLIREMFSIHKFRGDYQALGQMLSPPIGADEAREAVKTLLDLGLIRKNAQGSYDKADDILTIGYDAQGPLVENFFLQMHKLGGEALHRFPRKDRYLAFQTISISKATYKEIVEDLRAIRLKILDRAKKDSKPEALFQINFEVFPLTQRSGPEV